METTKIKQTGIDRTHDNSSTQKIVFITLHLFILVYCLWLIYFDGWQYIGEIFGKGWKLQDQTRATALLVFCVIYWLRHIVTLFYLLVRRIEWAEVFGLLSFFAFFEIGLVLIGGGAFTAEVIHFGGIDYLALALFALGSYLNSFSEIQRKWWKQNTENKGHCYTAGLFQYSMHMNYFGDMVLFSGWCLLTHSIWAFGLPILMTLMFAFHHIPSLDVYLLKRYGEEFRVYSEKTKKLIPYIY